MLGDLWGPHIDVAVLLGTYLTGWLAYRSIERDRKRKTRPPGQQKRVSGDH